MPKIDRDSARRALQSLQLPAVVLRLFDGEQVHPALWYRATAPDHPFTDGHGLEDSFVPFWECGTTISGYSRSAAQYQRVELEDIESPHFLSHTFRGLFCDLIISLWEDEADCDQLRELAELFQMPPIDQLIHSLETQPPYSSDWDRWRAGIVWHYEITTHHP